MTDAELIDRVMHEDEQLRERDPDDQRLLFESEVNAFADMHAKLYDHPGSALTTEQRQWLERAAVRLGVLSTAGPNIFSNWSPERRAQELARVRTKLPHELGPKVLKPPGRG